MNKKYTYRFLKSGEEKNAYELILKVFYEYVAPSYSQEGRTISNEELKNSRNKLDG